MATRVYRLSSLTALVLFAAMWAWSYPVREIVSYTNGRTYLIAIDGGRLIVGYTPSQSEPGFRHVRRGPDPEAGELDLFGGVRFLRFHFHPRSAEPAAFDIGFVAIPIWFPTLFLAAVTWWAWRKTPAKDGRGFAVEAGETSVNAHR